jgi:hypothetical protein
MPDESNTTGWQLIETAPLDALVLIYDPVGVVPGFNSVFSEWPESLTVHVLPARLVRCHRGDPEWETIVAEYDFGVPSDRSFDASSVSIAPTHWMPLPKPPEGVRDR